MQDTTLASTIVTGWIVAETRGIELPVDRPSAAAADIYWFLVVNNSRVLLSMVAGALTLGIYSALVIMWNGYFLGVGLASLRRAAPDLAAHRRAARLAGVYGAPSRSERRLGTAGRLH